MQKIYFITYADENYSVQQERLAQSARDSKQFDEIISYTKTDLINSEFYERNKQLLDERPIGDDGRVKPGYFAWKPYFIHTTLLKMNVNDIVMYVDCGDSLHETETLREFLLTRLRNIDMLLTSGAYQCKEYTRMDTFMYMNASSEKYYNALQVEAGIFVAKKAAFTMQVVNKWVRYASDRRVISDDANTCGIENFGCFKWSRWDQSILSILAAKSDIFRSNEMRKFVHCNTSDER